MTAPRGDKTPAQVRSTRLCTVRGCERAATSIAPQHGSVGREVCTEHHAVLLRRSRAACKREEDHEFYPCGHQREAQI